MMTYPRAGSDFMLHNAIAITHLILLSHLSWRAHTDVLLFACTSRTWESSHCSHCIKELKIFYDSFFPLVKCRRTSLPCPWQASCGKYKKTISMSVAQKAFPSQRPHKKTFKLYTTMLRQLRKKLCTNIWCHGKSGEL